MIEEVRSKLFAPFPVDDLEWRIIQSGSASGKVWAIIAPYIQARAVTKRLDEVFGILGWYDEYREMAGGILCRLTVVVNGASVYKEDGAQMTDIEPVKGGVSDALKRAAAKFGIGKYLYSLPTPIYADIKDDGEYRGRTKDGTSFKWSPPYAKLKEYLGVPSAPVKGTGVTIDDVRNEFELPRGNYDKCIGAIEAAKKDKEALLKVREAIGERSWVGNEKDMLLKTIDDLYEKAGIE